MIHTFEERPVRCLPVVPGQDCICLPKPERERPGCIPEPIEDVFHERRPPEPLLLPPPEGVSRDPASLPVGVPVIAPADLPGAVPCPTPHSFPHPEGLGEEPAQAPPGAVNPGVVDSV